MLSYCNALSSSSLALPEKHPKEGLSLCRAFSVLLLLGVHAPHLASSVAQSDISWCWCLSLTSFLSSRFMCLNFYMMLQLPCPAHLFLEVRHLGPVCHCCCLAVPSSPVACCHASWLLCLFLFLPCTMLFRRITFAEYGWDHCRCSELRISARAQCSYPILYPLLPVPKVLFSRHSTWLCI